MSDTLIINTESDQVKQSIPIFNLVNEDDPILREVLPEFDFANPPVNPAEFASSLVETCIANRGYGLSANQCGFRHRVFVMGHGTEYVAYYNPKIISLSEETTHMAEGCLSFPLLELKITRPSGIVVEYQDYNGETKKVNYVGLSARVFLHELDHMNGIVYTDKCKPLAMKMAKQKRLKMKKLVDRYQKAQKKIEFENLAN
jgi:peptide deformylase